MRMTLTLDDDLAARLLADSEHTGIPLSTLVNQHLRAALAPRVIVRSEPPCAITPSNLGGPASKQSYDDIGGLLENSEGADHR